MSTTALVAAAAVAVGAYALYRKTTAPPDGPPFASFGFRTLKLSRAQMVNHDVKRLRFDLGDPQTKSGLTLTSALLTISFPGGGWMPVLRPYTPVNDLGKAAAALAAAGREAPPPLCG
jgi:cytochrome-b5 reductase